MCLLWPFLFIVINLVLSGDNAVVIGLAAHRLPLRQRRIAIFTGGAVAVLLRIVLTATAALLLQITGLQFVGGMLLIWIAFKLLKEEEESKEGVPIAGGMREAIVTILVADFIMSTDNVLGVAARTHHEHGYCHVDGQSGCGTNQPVLVALVCRGRSYCLDGRNDDVR